jgi:hypothetical protein
MLSSLSSQIKIAKLGCWFVIAAFISFSSAAIAQDDVRKEIRVLPYPWVGNEVDTNKIRPALTHAVRLTFPQLTQARKINQQAVEWVRMRDINQQAVDGSVWDFDPTRPEDGWRRKGKFAPTAAGPTEDAVFIATQEMAAYLNYQASAQAVTLALSDPSGKKLTRESKGSRSKTSIEAMRDRHPNERAPAKDAVKLFYDTCVLLNQEDQTRFAAMVERFGVIMPADKAGPFLATPDGIAWDVRGENYAIAISGPPYYSCHMFVRFPPHDDILSEFTDMALRSTKNQTVRKYEARNGADLVFAWSELNVSTGASRTAAISIEPALQEHRAAPWPAHTFWVMSVRRDFGDDRMLFDLPSASQKSKKK